MQDNAPIHKARIVTEWLENYRIPTLEWPPYSPDLNPIEHAWARLKDLIVKLDPTIVEQGASKEVR